MRDGGLHHKRDMRLMGKGGERKRLKGKSRWRDNANERYGKHKQTWETERKSIDLQGSSAGMHIN